MSRYVACGSPAVRVRYGGRGSVFDRAGTGIEALVIAVHRGDCELSGIRRCELACPSKYAAAVDVRSHQISSRESQVADLASRPMARCTVPLQAALDPPGDPDPKVAAIVCSM